MSLTSALRPVGLPFGAGSKRETMSGDNLQTRPFQHEISYINLHRTLIRFQHLILLTPTSSATNSTELSPLQRQIQAELWSPLPYHRNKWLRNVEGARTLLLQLERKAQSIRVQRSKYEAIKDLAEKRAVIKKLRSRIEEIGREVEMMSTEDYTLPLADEDQGETLYDVLQQITRDKDEVDKQDATLRVGRPVEEVENEAGRKDKYQRQEIFASSEIRKRGKGAIDTTAKPEAQTSGFSNLPSTERSLMDASREQENITGSLVNMAVQLKQQSQAMNFALQQEKGILGRAMEGLDVNLTSMEAASKSMKFLQRMSEEEGWLGRMKLYAMIFGLWVVAFLLVFVAPKLRF